MCAKTAAILFRSPNMFPLSVCLTFTREFQILTHKFAPLSTPIHVTELAMLSEARNLTPNLRSSTNPALQTDVDFQFPSIISTNGDDAVAVVFSVGAVWRWDGIIAMDARARVVTRRGN